MIPEPPERVITWRGVIAGYVLLAAVFILMVAVSYPTVTLAVVAVSAGTYLLYRALLRLTTTPRVRLPRVRPRYEPTYRPR